MARTSDETAAFRHRLNRIYLRSTLGFIVFVAVVAVLEHMGLPRRWVGVVFLLATVALYAGIGIVARTTDATEYYVAGRRVPAIYNGMATAADWMSAASFIGICCPRSGAIPITCAGRTSACSIHKAGR